MAAIRVKQGAEVISLSLDFLGLLLLLSEFAALAALAASGSGADQAEAAGCFACLPLLTAVGYIVTDQQQSAYSRLVQACKLGLVFPLLIALPLLSEGSDIDTSAATMAIAMPAGTAIWLLIRVVPNWSQHETMLPSSIVAGFAVLPAVLGTPLVLR